MAMNAAYHSHGKKSVFLRENIVKPKIFLDIRMFCVMQLSASLPRLGGYEILKVIRFKVSDIFKFAV